MPPTYETTNMFREAGEAANVVAEQLAQNEQIAASFAAIFRALNPAAILTCARGSSDHAALYGKYLIETTLGVPVVSFSPSIGSVFKARQSLGGFIFIVISQSGRSPDLLAAARHAKDNDAYVVALVNDTKSPLSGLADLIVPLRAGPEKSVAATKSYICSLSALAQLVFSCQGDTNNLSGLRQLPEHLDKAWSCDWSAAIEPLTNANSLYVIGRGLGLAVAEEAALKFKETSGLHAEAFSAAEVKHGPMTIVRDGFPVFAFVPDDNARTGFEKLLQEFCGRRATCIVAGQTDYTTVKLPSVRCEVSSLTPIAQIQSFYRFINRLSLERGYNPDEPPFLKKVTETV